MKLAHQRNALKPFNAGEASQSLRYPRRAGEYRDRRSEVDTRKESPGLYQSSMQDVSSSQWRVHDPWSRADRVPEAPVAGTLWAPHEHDRTGAVSQFSADMTPSPQNTSSVWAEEGRWERDCQAPRIEPVSSRKIYSENPNFGQRSVRPQARTPSRQLGVDVYRGTARPLVNIGRRIGGRRGTRIGSLWKRALHRPPLATPLPPELGLKLGLTKELSRLSASTMMFQGSLAARPSGFNSLTQSWSGSSQKQERSLHSAVVSPPASNTTPYSEHADSDAQFNQAVVSTNSGGGCLSLVQHQKKMAEHLLDGFDYAPQTQRPPQWLIRSNEFMGCKSAHAVNDVWDDHDAHDPRLSRFDSGDPLMTTMPDHLMFGHQRGSIPPEMMASDLGDIHHSINSYVKHMPESGQAKSVSTEKFCINIVVRRLDEQKDLEHKDFSPELMKEVNGTVTHHCHQRSSSLAHLLTSCPPDWPSGAQPSSLDVSSSESSTTDPQAALSQPLSCPQGSLQLTWGSPTIQQAPGEPQWSFCNSILPGPEGDVIPFSLDSGPSEDFVIRSQGNSAEFSLLDFYEDRPQITNGDASQAGSEECNMRVGQRSKKMCKVPDESGMFADSKLGFTADPEEKNCSVEGTSPSSSPMSGTPCDSVASQERTTSSCNQKRKSSRFQETELDDSFRNTAQFQEFRNKKVLPDEDWEETEDFEAQEATEDYENSEPIQTWWSENSSGSPMVSENANFIEEVVDVPRLKLDGRFMAHVPVYSGSRVWSPSEVKRLSGVWMKDFKGSDDPTQLCLFLELGWIFQKAIMTSKLLEIDVGDECMSMKAKLFGLFEQTEQLSFDPGGCLVPRRDLRIGFTHIWLERIPGGLRQWSQWDDPVAGDKLEDYRLSADGRILTVYAFLVRQTGQMMHTRTVFNRM